MDSFSPEPVNLIRDLGTAGILALTLILIVRAITPLITALTEALKQQADARREQTEANRAVLKRWEESDSILEQSSAANLNAMQAITEEIKNLNAIDTQRIKQNDLTAANISGAREDIRTLNSAFVAGKDEVVNAMNAQTEAHGEALQEVKAALVEMRDKVDALLALLTQTASESAPPPVVVEPAEKDTGEESAA